MTYEIEYPAGSKEIVEKMTIEIIRRASFLGCKIYRTMDHPKNLKDD
jgi:hypothetical protein